MAEKADWAYDFTCSQPVEVILKTFNAAGPWQWQLRDSHFYGDYLNCRPMAHMRLIVCAYSDSWPVVLDSRRREELSHRFNAWLEIDPGSTADRSETDRVFRGLLQAIQATDIVEK